MNTFRAYIHPEIDDNTSIHSFTIISGILEERNASAMKRFFDVVELGLWSMLSTAALYNEHTAM